MSDNLSIKVGDTQISVPPEVLRRNYDQVVELCHLAILKRPVEPAIENLTVEPGDVDMGVDDPKRALAKRLVDAMEAKDPEDALRRMRDELRPTGGPAASVPDTEPKLDNLIADFSAVRDAALKHADLLPCGTPGLPGFRTDIMAIAVHAGRSWSAMEETRDALAGMFLALHSAGFDVRFDTSSSMPKNLRRLLDQIGVARRRGLTLKPNPKPEDIVHVEIKLDGKPAVEDFDIAESVSTALAEREKAVAEAGVVDPVDAGITSAVSKEQAEPEPQQAKQKSGPEKKMKSSIREFLQYRGAPADESSAESMTSGDKGESER